MEEIVIKYETAPHDILGISKGRALEMQSEAQAFIKANLELLKTLCEENPLDTEKYEKVFYGEMLGKLLNDMSENDSERVYLAMAYGRSLARIKFRVEEAIGDDSILDILDSINY